MFEEDEQEALVDKLRGGDYASMVDTAQKSHDAQMQMQMQQQAGQLCLRADGDVRRMDPLSAFVGTGTASQAGQAQAAAEAAAKAAAPESEEDELKRLRRERMQ